MSVENYNELHYKSELCNLSELAHRCEEAIVDVQHYVNLSWLLANAYLTQSYECKRKNRYFACGFALSSFVGLATFYSYSGPLKRVWRLRYPDKLRKRQQLTIASMLNAAALLFYMESSFGPKAQQVACLANAEYLDLLTMKALLLKQNYHSLAYWARERERKNYTWEREWNQNKVKVDPVEVWREVVVYKDVKQNEIANENGDTDGDGSSSDNYKSNYKELEAENEKEIKNSITDSREKTKLSHQERLSWTKLCTSDEWWKAYDECTMSFNALQKEQQTKTKSLLNKINIDIEY